MSTGGRPAGEALEGAQVNIARDRATQYITQGGDVHVHPGEASNYRVAEYRPHRPSLPVSVRGQPSRLLAARYQVVDFTGRDCELAELAGWRDDPDLGCAVRLVHGPGGQGKTRLAAQFAQRSTALGWVVAVGVHRSYDTAPAAGLDTERVGAGRGLLVIVDYAERWPVGDLLALARDPLLRTGVATRVLLVARPAGEWWSSLAYRLEDRFDMVADEMVLTALADSVVGRAAVFRAARDRFAALRGVADPDRIDPPAGLGEDVFGLVLTVHMAALAAVDAHVRGDQAPGDPLALSAYLLKREGDHWASMYDNDHRVHTSPQVMGRAVFTATLTRPLPYPEGITALHRTGLPTPGQVVDDHRVCYPPSDPATVCEPLYPDRLGEDFLALRTPGHTVAGNQPDPWAATAVARLLAPGGDGQPPVWAAAAVTVLIETARRWPHITRDQLCPLLRAQPQLAMAAGGVALARLAALTDMDPDVLEAIEALLPTGRHVDLDIAAAALTTRLTTDRLATTTDPAVRARLYAILGYRLAHAGQREQALEATTEAVDVYRRLAGVNPAAFDPDLAMALNNLGMMLSNLGRREEALAATTEAVDVYRRLAGVNPAAFDPDLATALNNLGMMLSNLGRREEALAATTEAVDVYRRLAGVNPAAFDPDLAMALNNLGMMLSNLGRREEALAATTEAVEIRRRLAGVNPAAFDPDLAMALNNLGNRLSNLGRREEALAATTEAVDVYRRLAGVNPAAFDPDLAMALNNLGIWLSDLGRREEALAATTEAVDVYRRLAGVNPAAFDPDLASALNNLGNRLSDLGRREEALAATTEAVDVYRRLAGVNPAAFDPDLAMALNNLGNRLSNLGRREEALAATTEAVEIRRRLAGVNPAAFDPDLASALNNLGMMLSNLGRREEALAATTEAVEIRRRLAGVNPAAFDPDLASALNNLGMMLSNLGRREEALAATTEAVDVYRRLAGVNPAAFDPDLASALNNLGMMLSNLGRREEALAATTEAVDVYRRLAGVNPAAFDPNLATALNNLGNRLSNLGRREEALAATTEAVDVYRRLAGVNPAAFDPDLATALNNLGMMLSNLGRREEALAATTEAVDVYRRLAGVNPAAFDPDLACGLWSFAWVRVAGQIELPQALTAAEESVIRYAGLVQQLPQAFTDDLYGALATLADVLDGLDRGEAAADVRRRIDYRG